MAEVPLNLDALCIVLQHTLSPDVAHRRTAENQLKNWRAVPTFLQSLASIMVNASLDVSVRSSAAIYLKQEVRNRWTVKEPPCYSEEERTTVRRALLELLTVAIADMGINSALTNNVDDVVRCVVGHDYPEGWPDAADLALESLQTPKSAAQVVASLVLLLALVRVFEYQRSALENVTLPSTNEEAHTTTTSTSPESQAGDNPENAHLAKVFLGLVRRVLPCTLQLGNTVVSTSGYMDNELSAATVKLICKIFWSVTQMSLICESEVLPQLDDWMSFLLKVIETPVPVNQGLEDKRTQENKQQSKCKKAAVQIVHRYLTRYSNKARVMGATEAGQELAHKFMERWTPRFTQSFFQMMSLEKSKQTFVPESVKTLFLQHFSACLSLSSTYRQVKPLLQFLLFEYCFPLLCFNDDDAELWETDPIEYIRSSALSTSVGLREAAIEFVQETARRRGKDTFQPILQFAESVFRKHQAHCADADTAARRQLDAEKDGAMVMIGCIADRLRSKKRNLKLETFMGEFVFPELVNPTAPFLRLRACWLYRNLLDNERDGIVTVLEDQKSLVAAFERIQVLCGDSELPVAVEAVLALRVFFSLPGLVREAVDRQIPQLMEQLFRVMSLMPDNEYIVSTIEALILNFEERIPPFAKSLVEYLSSALVSMLSSFSGEAPTASGCPVTLSAGPESPFSVASTNVDPGDATLSAMSAAQAICSVLSTLTEPQSQHILDVVAPPLEPLLDKLTSPEGLDLLDDGLAILTYLATFCRSCSCPVNLWKYFERMYQAVCGGNSSHLTLAGVCEKGWAPDYLERMLPVLDNLIFRDADAFATALSGIHNKPYPRLALEMAEKSATVLIEVDFEGAKSALELVSAMFLAFHKKTPYMDEYVEPACELVFRVFDMIAAEDESSNRDAPTAMVVRCLGAIVLYNPSLFFTVTERHGASQKALKVFLEGPAVIRAQQGKRIALLALLQLFELCRAGQLPTSVTGATSVEQVGLALAKLIMAQAKAYHDARAKADLLDLEGSECSDSESIDSEEDVDENEDAKGDGTQAFIEKLVKAAAEEREKVKDPENSLWEDCDDDEDDNEWFEEAATDAMPNARTPLEHIDDWLILVNCITNAPQLFVEAVGQNGFEEFRLHLEKERLRREEHTAKMQAKKTLTFSQC